MNKKIITILIIIILVIIAGGFWYANNQNNVILNSFQNLNKDTQESQKPVKQQVTNEKEQIAKKDDQKQDNENIEELKIEDIDTSNWKTYRNEEIGVEFKYPSSWNKLVEWGDVGCYDYEKQTTDTSMFTEDDKCNQIALKSQKDVGLFFATETPLMSKTGSPRDGYFGDQSGQITGLLFIKNFCKDKNKKDCKVYKTKNNITVAKNKEQVPFTDNDFAYVYYISSPNPVYKGIVFSTERLPYSEEENIEVIEEIINSLQFISKK